MNDVSIELLLLLSIVTLLAITCEESKEVKQQRQSQTVEVK